MTEAKLRVGGFNRPNPWRELVQMAREWNRQNRVVLGEEAKQDA